MMDEKIFDTALDNARKLGQCRGLMIYLLRYSELTKNNWEIIARTYINVSDNVFGSEEDLAYIHREALSRGIDIG